MTCEQPPTQVDSSSGPQPATVLRQQEQLVNTTLANRHGHSIRPPNEKPFIMSQSSECKGKSCPYCGRRGRREPQTFLSIDSVLKSDFSPTAAGGYGFHCRPVANANVVKNLGLRDPKTGLLPGQIQKVKNNKEDMSGKKEDGVAKNVEGTGSEKAQVATEALTNVELVEAEKFELIEATASLHMDGQEYSNDHLGPEAISKAVANDDDSSDDVIQIYVDSNTNSQAVGINIEDKKDVASATINEAVEDGELRGNEAY